MRGYFVIIALAALCPLCTAPQKANAFDHQSYGGPTGRVGSISTTPYPPAGREPPVAYVVVVYPVYRSALPAPVVIGAYDSSFTPRTHYVRVGTTVTWVNYGSRTYSVTADDSSWGSGDLAPGAAYAVMFTQPGTFRYHCRHHKGMVGTVVVDGGSSTGY